MIRNYVKLFLCFVPLLLIQCEEPMATKNGDKTKMKTKKPQLEPKFDKLMNIADLAEFKSFIKDIKNKDVILRVPMHAAFKESRVFGPVDYFIAGQGDENEKIKLKLNDTRMGIGVNSHLMSGCEEDTCTFWLDVQWQGMDGKHATENDVALYEVMALAFKEDSNDLDREFVYVRK